MSVIALFECTLVDARTQEVLWTATLPVVPRVGDELRVRGELLRVVGVRYELEERQRVRLGHLARITISLQSIA